MTIPAALEALPTWMGEAFVEHGFTELTAVQEAVWAPATRDRDLRIASATGSGKTVAVAMAVADAVQQACDAREAGEVERGDVGRPPVLVVAPTRELATQLQGELRWIYGALHAHVARVIGGASYGEERRSLRRGPAVLVGTPGRLVDHVKRGSLSLDAVSTVVLDEADQLMELGFKAELDTILGACATPRRTLLVSATFGPAVRALADRHQRDPLAVKGTPTGADHADIEHVVHPISGRDQMAALCNVLLAAPPSRTLVFVAMRAQAAQVADGLRSRGFEAAALSGELSQAERQRTLSAFRDGHLRVLVATDVAARGIDVQDIQTVVHACPPRDVEALIHRSGRTGRAGQKGRSVMLAIPSDVFQVRRVLQQAKTGAQWKPAPSEERVRAILDARRVEQLREDPVPQGHARGLARELLAGADAEEVVARLLERLSTSDGCAPQPVEAIATSAPRPPLKGKRPQRQWRGPPGRARAGGERAPRRRQS